MLIDLKLYAKVFTAFFCLAAAAYAYTERLAFSDARAAALGGGPALDAGLYALGTNPAALVFLPAMQFGLNHKDYPVAYTTAETVGAAFPLDAYGTVAGGFKTVRIGKVEAYNPQGRYVDTYTYHDDRLAVGYGVRPTRWFAVGGAFNYDRYVTSPELRFQTFGADAGVYFRPLAFDPPTEYKAGALALAATLQNLAATSEYEKSRNVTAGVSWARDVGPHRLMINVSAPLAEQPAVALGCEFVIASAVAVRGGVTGSRPALGLGFSTDLFSFDYCYQLRDLGAYHYFSFSLNPGRDIRGRSEKRRQTEKWVREGRAYYEAGNYELAAERFANVLDWDPHDARARQYWIRAKYHGYLSEGLAALGDKDWEGARRAFRAALVVEAGDFLATEYLARVDQLEEEEEARRAEAERVAQALAEAETLSRRGAYRRAMSICEDILAAHPEHAETRKLLAKVRRLYAASIAKPPPVTAPVEIPPEAVARYREGAALLTRGAVGEAVDTLAAVVSEYPSYGDARAKLVTAYLYQGLDFYSQGSLAAALRVWRRARALEPGNEKVKRYIKKAEREIDQIR